MGLMVDAEWGEDEVEEECLLGFVVVVQKDSTEEQSNLSF